MFGMPEMPTGPAPGQPGPGQPAPGQPGPGQPGPAQPARVKTAPQPPWRSAPRRRSVPRPQLSREVVVEAALQVLEKDGGEALTMRRVADQIGVSASSLYGYVANKGE